MRLVFSLLCLICPLLFSAQLSVNELSAKGGVMSAGQNEDWLEIINTSSEPIFLGDYSLSDDADDLQQWSLPNYTLPAGELLLIIASGNDVDLSEGVWQAFILAENEWRYFPATEEPPAEWNTLEFNDSDWLEAPGGFGYADGDDETQLEGFPSVYLRKEFQISDPSVISELVLHADYDDAFVAYLNGTEIARSDNIQGFPPAYNSYATIDHEAVLYAGGIPEVYSISAAEIESLVQEGENVLAIQVNNVSDESSDMSSLFFLSGLLDSFDSNYQAIPEWFQAQMGAASQFECNFKLSSGETVFITHNSGSVIESVTIPEDLATGLSYGREPDGTGDWCYFDMPTPEEPNGESWCFSGITPDPIINLPSGWYDGLQTLTAEESPNVIRYTTNGDVPTLDSPIFSQEEIDENASYSFRAFSEEGMLPSKVVDRTYILDEDNHGLPVFSIHTDHAHLWDWNEGIYVFGPNAETDFPYFGSNFWEPWSRFSRLEYFNATKELKAEEYLDLEIHGGWSRGESQKSFRLDLKSSYTGNLEEPLFSQKPFIENVNNMNLRTGGQHLWTDKIQDGLFSRLVNDLHLDNMAYEPCLLYLNGEFWGVYGIREKMDKHYIESNHGVNSSQVDLLNSWGALEGSASHFYEAQQELMIASSQFPGYYALASSSFDLGNYIDYFIAETYFQNKDWMGIQWGINNVKLWRPQTPEGKWRYMMYDLDFGFGFLWGNVNDNFIEIARNPLYPNPHSELFDKLLQNQQFKCEFAQRYADVLNTTFQPEHFSQVTNELVEQMEGAMELQAERWAENVTVDQWYEEVAELEAYNSTRVNTARIHLVNELDLGGQYSMTFNVFPEGAGTIQVNTITPESFPWTGIYFNNCPVQITATPAEGYEFTSWDANGIITEGSGDQVLLENLFQNDVFTANFSTEGDGVSVPEISSSESLAVFPNPTQGRTTIKYTSGSVEEVEVRVLDGLGRTVYNHSCVKSSREFFLDLDLSDLNKGVYLIELTASSTSFSRRLALQ